MKYYYPEIEKKIKIKYISDNPLIYKPWSFLEYYWLKNKNNQKDYLHIPSNTQMSEFLNKFNENHINIVLGEIKLREMQRDDKNSLGDLNKMVDSYGWNWINWKLTSSQKVLDELIKVENRILKEKNELSNQTLKIMGKIRLKESTDYGKNVEKAITDFITKDVVTSKYEWEIRFFSNLLDEGNFVILGHNQHIVDNDGIMQGEIDYILMNKENKKIYLSDLKTATTADKTDYWRQLAVYRKILINLNPHLKSMISDDVIIFHVNEKKNVHRLISKNMSNGKIEVIVNKMFDLKKEYLQVMLEYENK